MQYIEDILKNSECIPNLKDVQVHRRTSHHDVSSWLGHCIGKCALVCGMIVKNSHKGSVRVVYEWIVRGKRCKCVESLYDVIELIMRDHRIKNPYLMVAYAALYSYYNRDTFINICEEHFSHFKEIGYDINTIDHGFVVQDYPYSNLAELHGLFLKHGCKYVNMTYITKVLWKYHKYDQYVYNICIEHGFPRYKAYSRIYIDGLYKSIHFGVVLRTDMTKLVYYYGKISDIELATCALHSRPTVRNLEDYYYELKHRFTGIPYEISKRGKFARPIKSRTSKSIYSLKSYIKYYIVSRSDTIFDLDEEYNIALWR